MLQHLGPLIAYSAHKRLWPAIIDWVHTRWRQIDASSGRHGRSSSRLGED
jgi:hypothetical protein